MSLIKFFPKFVLNFIEPLVDKFVKWAIEMMKTDKMKTLKRIKS